ncbi:MAG: hypothetical protein FVQ80_10175 [Planctomycetes bacterium]|nr:hypothetical protein [Planctomycetota bacterium]
MKALIAILEFLLYALLLTLLGAPLVLIVLFPSSAEHFTRFAETMVPWGVVLLLAAIFNDGIKSLFSKIVETLSRLKSVSAAGAAIELNPQGIGGANLTEEQSQLIRQHIQELSQQNEDATNLASHFFLKYVGSTIYGSQYRLLEALENTPLTSSQAIKYYNQFVASAPESTDYPFENWLEYLTSNLLIQLDPDNTNYTITNAGLNFLRRTREANLNEKTFKH